MSAANLNLDLDLELALEDLELGRGWSAMSLGDSTFTTMLTREGIEHTSFENRLLHMLTRRWPAFSCKMVEVKEVFVADG